MISKKYLRIIAATALILAVRSSIVRFPGLLQHGQKCMLSHAGVIVGMTCDGSMYLECSSGGICSCINVMKFNNDTQICEVPEPSASGKAQRQGRKASKLHRKNHTSHKGS
ncbi:unnamed protein product [Allacma fusca]|uniref:Uncharacterized protein n=1 Tax=Allacma fusca TaxID=39272 RepID=A0A8J2KRH1_9HEXA|nr:unnamed protein product [Allacma fusca]